MAVQHIVLCKLRPGCDRQFDTICHGLNALRNHLTIGAMSHGPNTSPEGLGRGYTHGFVIEFPDEVARDAYLEDPAHQALGAQLLELCEGGVGGVLVVDF